MGHATLFVISILLFGIPLILSFHKKFYFVSDYKDFLISCIVTNILVMPWLIGFKAWAVFYYNPQYISSITIATLPIEHYLYVFGLVYLNLYIYNLVRKVVPIRFLMKIYYGLTLVVFVLLILLIKDHLDETLSALSVTVMLFLLLLQLINRRIFMVWFYPAIFVSIVPMLLINAYFFSLPMYIIMEESVAGLKFLSIPLELFLFQGAVFLISLTVFEWSDRNFFLKEKLEKEESIASDHAS